jgi:hypothetical protein
MSGPFGLGRKLACSRQRIDAGQRSCFGEVTWTRSRRSVLVAATWWSSSTARVGRDTTKSIRPPRFVNARRLHAGYPRAGSQCGSFKHSTRRPWARDEQIGSARDARTSVSQRVSFATSHFQRDWPAILNDRVRREVDVRRIYPNQIKAACTSLRRRRSRVPDA